MTALVVTLALEAFDFGDGEVSVTPGARGALGRVWRVASGRGVYALKEVFAGAPPAPDGVEAEVTFALGAAAAGIRVPASHPSRNGLYVVPLPDGGWLRLYDWVDLRPADLAASTEALGVLLARLHQCAPMVGREPDGTRLNRWYERPPGLIGWDSLVAAATESGMSWSAPLAGAVDGLPALHVLLSTADQSGMRMCHRDLHPGNVLADEAGDLVVVDWDDFGPAEPARELASAIVACFHDGDPNLASMQRTYWSYVEAGGPARVRSAADFTMLIATELNFLDRQVRVALDLTASPRDRDWAVLEIEEGLRILPTPDLVAAVLHAVTAPP